MDLVTFSKNTQAECKQLNIEPRQKAFIDLVILGWKIEDAYQLCGLSEANDSTWKIKTKANDILCNYAPTVSYYERMKGKPMPKLAPEYDPKDRIKEGGVDEEDEYADDLDPDFNGNYNVSDDDLSKETSKDYQLKEWIVAKRKYKIGSKPWVDAQKAIADITQAKKEKSLVEEKHTVFYLPLKCSNCSLYLANNKKK